MTDKWYYRRDGGELGPVSAAGLRALAGAGGLLPTDLIRRDGTARWVPARSAKGLFPAGPNGGQGGRNVVPSLAARTGPPPLPDETGETLPHRGRQQGRAGVERTRRFPWPAALAGGGAALILGVAAVALLAASGSGPRVGGPDGSVPDDRAAGEAGGPIRRPPADPDAAPSAGFDPRGMILGRWQFDGDQDVAAFREGGGYEQHTSAGVVPGAYKFVGDDQIELFRDLGGVKYTHYYRLRFTGGGLELIERNDGFDGQVSALVPRDGQALRADPRRASAGFASPPPGSAWYEDRTTLRPGGRYTVRRRHAVGPDGGTDVTATRETFHTGLRACVLRYEPSVPGDRPPGLEPRREVHRLRGGFAEVGRPRGDGGYDWEPVLKDGAGVGERWEWDGGTSGGPRVYEIDGFGADAGRATVTVRVTRPRRAESGGRAVAFRTYARGVGLVRQSETRYDADGKYALLGRTVRADGVDAADAGPVVVRAEEFAREFRADRERANDRYAGRVVEVTGVVAAVASAAPHPRVTLVGKAGDTGTAAPTLWFPSRHAGALGGVRKGAEVTARGVCTGDAQLHHCSLSGPPEVPPEGGPGEGPLSPRTLVLAGLRDRAAAAERFAGRDLTLAGHVAGGLTGGSRGPHVLLDAGSDLQDAVFCRLAAKPAAPFKPGDRVVLRGRCVGFDAPGAGPTRVAVLFEDCRPVAGGPLPGPGTPPPPASTPPAPGPKAGEWTRLDPMPRWKPVWGEWAVAGQTLAAQPDGAGHWKTALLDREFDSLRATVAVRRPGKPDGWAGFDFGHRGWDDRETVVLHQGRVVVSRSRPDGKGGAAVTERKAAPLNAKAAASPWSYFRVECEGGRVRVEGSSDGAAFHPVYEAASDGYRPGRVGFSVREGGHGGEFRLVRLETRDAPAPPPPAPSGSTRR